MIYGVGYHVYPQPSTPCTTTHFRYRYSPPSSPCQDERYYASFVLAFPYLASLPTFLLSRYIPAFISHDMSTIVNCRLMMRVTCYIFELVSLRTNSFLVLYPWYSHPSIKPYLCSFEFFFHQCTYCPWSTFTYKNCK